MRADRHKKKNSDKRREYEKQLEERKRQFVGDAEEIEIEAEPKIEDKEDIEELEKVENTENEIVVETDVVSKAKVDAETEKAKIGLEEKKNTRLTFKEVLKEVLIAVVITVIILTFIGPTAVKEHSMQPTVNDGDYLILNKLLYREPKHGDIVVFKSDLKTEEGKPMNLIKRVIGVEGDIITINGGNLFRNGQLVKEPYIYDQCIGEVYNYVVPKDEIYVLGDHREVSRDSRELGSVSKDRIIGEAFFRVYPLSNFGFVK